MAFRQALQLAACGLAGGSAAVLFSAVAVGKPRAGGDAEPRAVEPPAWAGAAHPGPGVWNPNWDRCAAGGAGGWPLGLASGLDRGRRAPCGASGRDEGRPRPAAALACPERPSEARAREARTVVLLTPGSPSALGRGPRGGAVPVVSLRLLWLRSLLAAGRSVWMPRREHTPGRDSQAPPGTLLGPWPPTRALIST